MPHCPAWSPLPEEAASLIGTVRLDMSDFLASNRRPPPVWFRDFDELTMWARVHGLDEPKKVKGARVTSAVRISGQGQALDTPRSFWYDQIWVRASYTRYRKALEAFALAGFSVDRSALREFHADHVINRKRLLDFPGSWVAIFPVHEEANCPFGRIEAMLPPVPSDAFEVALPPLVALKLFCGKMPTNSAELKHAMCDVRGQFDTSLDRVDRFCAEMETEAGRYISS